MAKKAKTNGMMRYTTYNFTDHDPILDWVDMVKKDSQMSVSEIVAKSRVSGSTIRNWINRNTKRPQFSTVAAVAAAMGADSLPITPEARRALRKEMQK